MTPGCTRCSTDDGAARKFAPGFAPARYKPGQTGSTADKGEGGGGPAGSVGAVAGSGDPVKGKDTLTGAVNGPHPVGAGGVGPATACCRTRWRCRGRPGRWHSR